MLDAAPRLVLDHDLLAEDLAHLGADHAGGNVGGGAGAGSR